MKKKCFTLLLMISSLLSFGDWKSDVKKYWDSFEDYKQIISYIENKLESIPGSQMSTALGILAYAYNMEDNSAGEIRAVRKLFLESGSDFKSPAFLDLAGRIKVYDFIERWKKKFPNITGLKVADKNRRFSFFYPPSNIELIIFSKAASGGEIKSIEGKNRSYKFFLNEGENRIRVPIDVFKLNRRETMLDVMITCGLISVPFRLIVKKDYLYPDELDFFVETGNIKFKNRDFKSEKYNVPVTITKKYFDKKNLLRRSLIPAGIGASLLIINKLVIAPTLENESTPSSALFRYSGWRSINLVSAGLLIKGFFGLGKLFRREKTRKIEIRTDKEAIKYNRLLKKVLEKKKKDVIVELNMKLSGGKK